MNYMRNFFVLVICFLMVSCTSWQERYIPTTDKERIAVAELQQRILEQASSVTSLAGHDQDWDDVISSAYHVSVVTICRPTYWEYRAFGNSGYTGRWRYADSLSIDKTQ
jgi:hypothetical protein